MTQQYAYNGGIIFELQEYVRTRESLLLYPEDGSNRPKQKPFSKWAVDEIIEQLLNDFERYPDEIIRDFISLMKKYEYAADNDRKILYKTAGDTAKEIYTYLFDSYYLEEENF